MAQSEILMAQLYNVLDMLSFIVMHQDVIINTDSGFMNQLVLQDMGEPCADNLVQREGQAQVVDVLFTRAKLDGLFTRVHLDQLQRSGVLRWPIVVLGLTISLVLFFFILAQWPHIASAVVFGMCVIFAVAVLRLFLDVYNTSNYNNWSLIQVLDYLCDTIQYNDSNLDFLAVNKFIAESMEPLWNMLIQYGIPMQVKDNLAMLNKNLNYSKYQWIIGLSSMAMLTLSTILFYYSCSPLVIGCVLSMDLVFVATMMLAFADLYKLHASRVLLEQFKIHLANVGVYFEHVNAEDDRGAERSSCLSGSNILLDSNSLWSLYGKLSVQEEEQHEQHDRHSAQQWQDYHASLSISPQWC